MAILQGDIKLLASKVMLDVPEGGGGPTSTVIPDGVSNAVFPDISELDRTNGRVNARQLHVTVQSNDTATYLGSNIIVAQPPDDPNVSITLFSTGDQFDKRTEAIARIEAYLSIGTLYGGYLFGNHIAGQRTILLIQSSATPPAIGDTLVMTKREGFTDEQAQYVRVTSVAVEERTFADTDGEYIRFVVTLDISDVLRYDFQGFDASRSGPSQSAMAAKTKMSESTVADAARYYGVVDLVTAGSIGDFTIKGSSVFSQLVPSAQIETPVADARANQTSTAVIEAGEALSFVVSRAFTTTSSIFTGGAVTPGTFVMRDTNNATPEITDDLTGKLFQATIQVGNIDYENGILTAATVVHDGTVPLRITYKQGATPTTINQTKGFEISQANRSLNYVRTIEPPPVPGTLNISYRVNARWYVLRADGSGAIRGLDSSYGAGSLNPTTGTVSVTLGALPDVGSSIIFQWVMPEAARDNALIGLNNDGKLYWPLNTSGVSAVTPGAKSITPGAVSVTWSVGGVTKTTTDDGLGVLQGDATGSVDYANGVLKISPNTLPPVGTVLTLGSSGGTPVTQNLSLGTSGNYRTVLLGPSAPGQILFQLTGQRKFSYEGGPSREWGEPVSYLIFDQNAASGTGSVHIRVGVTSLLVGSITYATGACEILTNLPLPEPSKIEAAKFDNIFQRFENYNILGLRAT